MKKVSLALFIVVLLGSILVGYFLTGKKSLPIPNIPVPVKEPPLLQYTIENMHQRQFQASNITLQKLVKVTPQFASFTFSFQTLNKKMTGLINIPLDTATNSAQAYPTLLLIRGYIPPATYQPGAGTKNAGEYFAQHGYVTVAPDFFGFAESDKESTDEWEARFQKPISVVELLNTVQQTEKISIPSELLAEKSLLSNEVILNSSQIGIWAHSNGGQIALTALEISPSSVPATLWAPVTAPFPYSVLYFSDEEADEGKESRKWIAQFDQDYDATQFSLTQHLNFLSGPLQIQQGVADEAIHYIWSDEFVDKIKTENKKRASLDQAIKITYYKYPNSNHNMQPDWSTAIQRDLDFFNKNVKNEN